jgi:hypothetical protein
MTQKNNNFNSNNNLNNNDNIKCENLDKTESVNAKDELLRQDMMKKLSLKEKWLNDNSTSVPQPDPFKPLEKPKETKSFLGGILNSITSLIKPHDGNKSDKEGSPKRKKSKTPDKKSPEKKSSPEKIPSRKNSFEKIKSLKNSPSKAEKRKSNSPVDVDLDKLLGDEKEADVDLDKLLKDEKPRTPKPRPKKLFKQKSEEIPRTQEKVSIPNSLKLFKQKSEEVREEADTILTGIEEENERLEKLQREMEIKRFADNMNAIKSSVVDSKVASMRDVNLSKYFPSQTDKKPPQVVKNRDAKALKDINLLKYFSAGSSSNDKQNAPTTPTTPSRNSSAPASPLTPRKNLSEVDLTNYFKPPTPTLKRKTSMITPPTTPTTETPPIVIRKDSIKSNPFFPPTNSIPPPPPARPAPKKNVLAMQTIKRNPSPGRPTEESKIQIPATKLPEKDPPKTDDLEMFDQLLDGSVDLKKMETKMKESFKKDEIPTQSKIKNETKTLVIANVISKTDKTASDPLPIPKKSEPFTKIVKEDSPKVDALFESLIEDVKDIEIFIDDIVKGEKIEQSPTKEYEKMFEHVKASSEESKNDNKIETIKKKSKAKTKKSKKSSQETEEKKGNEKPGILEKIHVDNKIFDLLTKEYWRMVKDLEKNNQDDSEKINLSDKNNDQLNAIENHPNTKSDEPRKTEIFTELQIETDVSKTLNSSIVIDQKLSSKKVESIERVDNFEDLLLDLTSNPVIQIPKEQVSENIETVNKRLYENKRKSPQRFEDCKKLRENDTVEADNTNKVEAETALHEIEIDKAKTETEKVESETDNVEVSLIHNFDVENSVRLRLERKYQNYSLQKVLEEVEPVKSKAVEVGTGNQEKSEENKNNNIARNVKEISEIEQRTNEVKNPDNVIEENKQVNDLKSVNLVKQIDESWQNIGKTTQSKTKCEEKVGSETLVGNENNKKEFTETEEKDLFEQLLDNQTQKTEQINEKTSDLCHEKLFSLPRENVDELFKELEQNQSESNKSPTKNKNLVDKVKHETPLKAKRKKLQKDRIICVDSFSHSLDESTSNSDLIKIREISVKNKKSSSLDESIVCQEKVEIQENIEMDKLGMIAAEENPLIEEELEKMSMVERNNDNGKIHGEKPKSDYINILKDISSTIAGLDSEKLYHLSGPVVVRKPQRQQEPKQQKVSSEYANALKDISGGLVGSNLYNKEFDSKQYKVVAKDRSPIREKHSSLRRAGSSNNLEVPNGNATTRNKGIPIDVDSVIDIKIPVPPLRRHRSFSHSKTPEPPRRSKKYGLSKTSDLDDIDYKPKARPSRYSGIYRLDKERNVVVSPEPITPDFYDCEVDTIEDPAREFEKYEMSQKYLDSEGYIPNRNRQEIGGRSKVQKYDFESPSYSNRMEEAVKKHSFKPQVNESPEKDTSHLLRRSHQLHTKKENFMKDHMVESNPYIREMLKQDIDNPIDFRDIEKIRRHHTPPAALPYTTLPSRDLPSRDMLSRDLPSRDMLSRDLPSRSSYYSPKTPSFSHRPAVPRYTSSSYHTPMTSTASNIYARSMATSAYTQPGYSSYSPRTSLGPRIADTRISSPSHRMPTVRPASTSSRGSSIQKPNQRENCRIS